MQGDQLGVEFGISAHVGLLVEEGALLEEHMLRTDRLPRPNGLFQGLVIDDFSTLLKFLPSHFASLQQQLATQAMRLS